MSVTHADFRKRIWNAEALSAEPIQPQDFRDALSQFHRTAEQLAWYQRLNLGTRRNRTDDDKEPPRAA